MTDTTGLLAPESPLRVTRTKSVAAGVARPPQPMHTVGSTVAYATDARSLTLLDRAVLPPAHSLIAHIQAQVVARETRGNQRRASGQQKLRVALEGIIGGVLVAWMRHDALVRRVLMKAEFTGEEVGYAAAIAALAALVGLGLIRRIKDSQQPISFDAGPVAGWRRLSTRFGPCAALLGLAAGHGITGLNVGEAFRPDYAAARPRAVDALVLKPFKLYPGRKSLSQPPPLAVDWTDPEVARMVAEVRFGNTVLDRHVFAGCVKPVLYRQFIGTMKLHGRWYASGPVSVTHMPRRDRPAILIDGQPVAEIDVNASQLRILLAASGILVLAGDPYTLPHFERNAVKGLITIMLGLGGPPDALTPAMLTTHPALNAADCTALQAAILALYPCLSNPSVILGVPKRRVAIRLQFLEARSLSLALRELWNADCAALPIHDCVIVPAAQVALAERALSGGWEASTGARVEVKVTTVPVA